MHTQHIPNSESAVRSTEQIESQTSIGQVFDDDFPIGDRPVFGCEEILSLNVGWLSPIVSPVQYDSEKILAFAPDFNLNLKIALEKAFNLDQFRKSALGAYEVYIPILNAINLSGCTDHFIK